MAASTLRYCKVTHALYRYQQIGLMSEWPVRVALKAALALPLDLCGKDDLYPRAVELARRFTLPAAYDAHYLALAEQRGAKLWTADGALACASRPTLPWVRLVRSMSVRPDGVSG